MEASASEQINLGLLVWNNGHRSPTADDYFFPHEVRSLVKRQKINEVTISLLLAVVYILIMAGSGLSFYFFYDVQDPSHGTTFTELFSQNCHLVGTASTYTQYPCYVVYVSQIVTALGAIILLIGSLVKSCCCMW